MSILHNAIQKIVERTNLSITEATEAFDEIMSGGATDAQIAALIIGLRMKGETADEITGAAEAMRSKVLRIEPKSRDNLIDTCGTGGDGANTFNISTAAAFVAAGAGARVAKHGNRNISSKCGSADVLEALGVNISITPQRMCECLDRAGMAFLFAPALHKAMKYAIGPRREIAIRTIFNVLGPLTNPALAPGQVLGVFSANLTETMAIVLKNLGINHAYIVHGMDGLDEISLCAATKVSEVSSGAISTYMVQPEDFGLARVSQEAIAGGEPSENAAITIAVLDGETGPRRDIVCLNAAFALAAAGIAATPEDGLERARRSIDSGAAKDKLRHLIDLTNTES